MNREGTDEFTSLAVNEPIVTGTKSWKYKALYYLVIGIIVGISGTALALAFITPKSEDTRITDLQNDNISLRTLLNAVNANLTDCNAS